MIKINKLSAKTFDIDVQKIEYIDKLKEIAQKISSIARTKYLERYETIEDYVIIHYYFRFVELLTCKQIMEKLNLKNPTRVSLAYSGLGWNWGYEGNFEEVTRQYEEDVQSLNKINNISPEEIEQKLKDDNDFLIYFDKFKNEKLRHIHQKMGFKTPDQYIKKMYYLVKHENLTSQQLARLFNIHGRLMQKHLVKINLNMDIQTANEKAVMNGRRNFKKSSNNARKTTINNIIKNGLFGTQEENIARSSLETLLIDYFDSVQYEIIVGINSHYIIPPKEVDIPLILINKTTQQIFKIAIEFNGDGYHKNDDGVKKELLIKNGWKYYSIWYRDNTSHFQKEVYGSITEQLKRCCSDIKNLIDISNTNQI